MGRRKTDERGRPRRRPGMLFSRAGFPKSGTPPGRPPFFGKDRLFPGKIVRVVRPPLSGTGRKKAHNLSARGIGFYEKTGGGIASNIKKMEAPPPL